MLFDTNVLIASFGKSSPYRKIFDSFLNYQFTLLLSNETLLEYLEIIQKKANSVVAENIIMSLLCADNTELIEIFFHWSLIEYDKDDNKFCDLAVAGNADYLVTNDTHFNVVKLNSFPPVHIISADEFIKIIS
ncbi:MAG: putative toxin-antitoxin system toxin component, PIN family [Bacteroidota bacterium]